MKCKKCGKKMDVPEQMKQTVALVTGKAEGKIEPRFLNKQTFLCEHCEQPYTFLMEGKKLNVIPITAAWIAKRSKRDQKALRRALKDMKQHVKEKQLEVKWIKRLSE